MDNIDDDKKFYDSNAAVKGVIEHFRRLQNFWEEKSKGEYRIISNDVQIDTFNSVYKLHGPIYVHIKRNVTVETKTMPFSDVHTQKMGCREKHVSDEQSKKEDQHISKDVQIDTFNTVYYVHGPIYVHINRKSSNDSRTSIQARQPHATRQIDVVDNKIFPKLKTFWEEKTKAEEHGRISKDAQIDTFNTVYKLHGPIYEHIFPNLKIFREEKNKTKEHRHILKDVQIDTFNTVYKLHGPIYVHIHRRKIVDTLILAVNENCPSRQTDTFKSFLAGAGVLGVCFALVRMLMPPSVSIRLI
ncbi:unnamed protein product [Mytilus edulis]|uniref:Uncharacterized protein n=1 Tax=Mytilus edulis TaxID=6550 RepID=A0A8S3Q4B5_MYTED|nr:unnamed protein product [Mytilus edulis]